MAGLTEAQLLNRVARRDDSAEAAFEAILTQHGPAAGLKAVAVVLAIFSLISVGACLAALNGREPAPRLQAESPRQEPAARTGASAVDRYGDPLPRGAITRLGTTRFRHSDGFPRVFFAPDGKTLVTAGGAARVWDTATGRLLRSFDAGWVVVPSPDGRTLFAAGYGFLRAIDGVTGRELRRVALDLSVLPDRLAISPDGKALAVLIGFRNQMHRQKDLSTLILLDADTLAARWRIEKGPPYTEELAFSPDGRLLAISGPAEGARRFGMMEPKASTIRLLDVAGGAEVRRIPVEGFGVGSLAFAPDGQTLAAGVGDRTVRLYDPATGRERLPRLGRERAVPPSPEGKGQLKGFGAAKGFEEAKAREPSFLAFSPDGKLLASGLEDLGYYGGLIDVPPITLWDVAAAREVHRLAGQQRGITSLAFSPDGRTLAASGANPAIRLWDAATGREVDQRPGHPDGIDSLAVSAADGTVFTAGQADGLVIQWDPADGRSLGQLDVRPQMFDGMAISADGRTLLIGDPFGPVVWDVVARKERCRINDKDLHERFVRPSVAPDGRTVSSGLSVWDAANGRRLVTMKRGGWQTNPYTTDGRRLIAVEQDGVHVWEIATGKEVARPIRAELIGWFNAAISPDGRLVAVGNVNKSQHRFPNRPEPKTDPAIRIWELASGKPVARLMGHTAQSCDLAFSPDSRMLASVSGGHPQGQRTGDRGLRVWDIATGRQERRFANYPGGGSLVAYLPDGRSIVTASGDGTALVWDVSDLADRRPTEMPDAKRLEALWSDLATDDAPRGYRASWALSAQVPCRSSAIGSIPPRPGSRPPAPRSCGRSARSLRSSASALPRRGRSWKPWPGASAVPPPPRTPRTRCSGCLAERLTRLPAERRGKQPRD